MQTLQLNTANPWTIYRCGPSRMWLLLLALTAYLHVAALDSAILEKICSGTLLGLPASELSPEEQARLQQKEKEKEERLQFLLIEEAPDEEADNPTHEAIATRRARDRAADEPDAQNRPKSEGDSPVESALIGQGMEALSLPRSDGPLPEPRRGENAPLTRPQPQEQAQAQPQPIAKPAPKPLAEMRPEPVTDPAPTPPQVPAPAPTEPVEPVTPAPPSAPLAKGLEPDISDFPQPAGKEDGTENSPQRQPELDAPKPEQSPSPQKQEPLAIIPPQPRPESKQDLSPEQNRPQPAKQPVPPQPQLQPPPQTQPQPQTPRDALAQKPAQPRPPAPRQPEAEPLEDIPMVDISHPQGGKSPGGGQAQERSKNANANLEGDKSFATLKGRYPEYMQEVYVKIITRLRILSTLRAMTYKEGVVTVRFGIAPDGTLSKVEIARAAEELVAERGICEGAVKTAAPFRPLTGRMLEDQEIFSDIGINFIY